MATYEEIEASIAIINNNFHKDITILHCISNYPTPYKDVNLSVIPELKKRFGYPVGFSDHTIGIKCALASVSMGASIVEKHVTLDKSQPGPDHMASATIEEFSQLVVAIRNIEDLNISDIVVSPVMILPIPASLRVVIPFSLACSNNVSWSASL